MTSRLLDISLDIPELDKIYQSLDNIYTSPHKSIIAISGGPDSMFAMVVIYNYWTKKKFDTKLLLPIYCDHAIRKDDDYAIIKDFIYPLSCKLAIRTDKGSYTEAKLRKRRHEQFKQYGLEQKSKILITGHNLSDRIESTFLNMLRGCQMPGFVSMKFQEEDSHMFGGKIVRPLIDLPKRHILHYCQKHNINFVKDHTNDDTSFSKRNKIRHNIIDPLLQLSHKFDTENISTFEKSFLHIYSHLSELAQNDISLVSLPMMKHRNTKFFYRWKCSQDKINNSLIQTILKKLHISHNITHKNLSEISTFLSSKSNGHKYINSTYFFISHGNIYIIKGPKKFRENKIKTKATKISDLFKMIDTENLYSIYSYDDISDWRFHKPGDKIKGKNFKKRCINQKIPIFWRNSIPISISQEKKLVPIVFDFMSEK